MDMKYKYVLTLAWALGKQLFRYGKLLSPIFELDHHQPVTQ